MKKKPVVLCIMDGFAITNHEHGNAILKAKKPNIDRLFAQYPPILLEASGLEVGLPEHQIGNSEVGHMNIGAGRVVYQSLTYINQKLSENDFAKNIAFDQVFTHCIEHGSALHIMGLLSDGGVHSHINHILGLIDLAKEKQIRQTFVHVFLDGRDVDPQSGVGFVRQLEKHLSTIEYGSIASISGRYFAMDRDKNFNRLDLAYQVMVEHHGLAFHQASDYVLQDYANQMAKKGSASDEFVMPAYHAENDGLIQDNDGVIFANFRPDRAIQLATLLTNPSFYKKLNYVPKKPLSNIFLVSMMHYADSVKGVVAYSLDELKQTLGVYLADLGLKQLRIAETEKYAHVTFFFDGTVNYDGIDHDVLPGCERILIQSPRVATYDLKPEMSAREITTRLLQELDRNYFDVVILNFANCDMVGHTAVMDAVVKAVETVDECVGRIYDYLHKIGGILLLTSDHGNADSILDDQNNPVTAHTTNPVPFVVCDDHYEFIKRHGKLADIAPSLLTIMDLPIPKEMTGQILLRAKRDIIETKRLILRPFLASDLDDFHSYCKVPGVGEAAGWPHHQSKEESATILDSFLTKSSEYAVVLKDENKVIGSLGIMQGDHKKNEKEIGYVLSKEYWNQGLMSEAVQGAIDYFFTKMKGKTLWVSHHVGNTRSQRVIEKNGFHYVGETERLLRLLNETRQSRVYKLTNKDYNKKGFR